MRVLFARFLYHYIRLEVDSETKAQVTVRHDSRWGTERKTGTQKGTDADRTEKRKWQMVRVEDGLGQCHLFTDRSVIDCRL